jgi:UPF0755 protein
MSRGRLFLALCISAFVAFSVLTYLFTKVRVSSPEILLIQRGEGISTLNVKLSNIGLSKDSILYKGFIYVFLRGKLYYGEYEVKSGDSLVSVLQKIKDQKFHYRKITFVEGETKYTYLNQINSAYGLVGNVTIDIKEGELMPETYFYRYGESKDELVKRMQTASKSFLDYVWHTRPENFFLKSKDEVLVLASIIEKEALKSEDKRKVASVFENRLKNRMKLQSCPTVIYQITNGQNNFNKPLSFNDLLSQGEYNTYVNYGLPPKAISNPSKESIYAAIHHPQTDFFYFVADGSGGHIFSKAFGDHVRYANAYRSTHGVTSSRQKTM